MAGEGEEWLALLSDATNEADLTTQEIPDIPLYLDQILSLMAAKNAQGSKRYADRLLTKTMVNNYSKDGLISPIKGKTYRKEQILQMLFISILKNTFSIGEIKQLFRCFSEESEKNVTTETEYCRFLDARAESREKSKELAQMIVASHDYDLTKGSDYLAAALSIAALSADLKNIAQAMIDARFPTLQPGKDREKEKKKKAKTKKEHRGNAAAVLENDAQAKKEEGKTT